MALSANATITKYNVQAICYDDAVIKSGVTVYEGALLSFTAAAETVEPSTNDAAANVFAGMAGDEGKTIFPILGDGVKTCPFFYNCEVEIPAAASVDAGDVGRLIYAADDASVSDVSSLGPIVGPVTKFIASTVVRVLLRGAINGPAAS
jgi:hypothetical protein